LSFKVKKKRANITGGRWTDKRMKTAKLANSYRIDDPTHFRMKDFNPTETGHWHSVEHAQEDLQKYIARMADLQAKLYAQDRWAVLLIFQAMDAGGKDGTIRHVMSGVNPEDCQVYSFNPPSAVTRPAVRGKSPRYCRLVPESAGPGSGFVRGRKSPNSSSESDAAVVADAAGPGRAPLNIDHDALVRPPPGGNVTDHCGKEIRG
jgi:hypothetical protein